LDWDEKFHKMAKQTEGFSGREIAKLAISWQVGIQYIYKCLDVVVYFFIIFRPGHMVHWMVN